MMVGKLYDHLNERDCNIESIYNDMNHLLTLILSRAELAVKEKKHNQVNYPKDSYGLRELKKS